MIRAISLSLALTIPLAVLPRGAMAGAEGFTWQPDLETAAKLSKEDGRPIALYFTFDT